MEQELAWKFVRFSGEKLAQFTERIGDCLGRLSEDQIWSRGSDNENAVGNLVLHLCGNLRQWIGYGVAGLADVRKRDAEFEARGNVPADELRRRLETVVGEARATIEGLSPERLLETTNVQGYDVTVLEAVYHAVEHFAQHTGQILYATKLLLHEDLGYYRHLSKSAGHEESMP